MPTLLDIQRATFRAMLSGELDDPVLQIAGGDFSAAERLSIYRNTFLSNLTNALRISYPAVHRLVGEDFFEAATQAFIPSHPPQSAYLNAYGAQFPNFIAQFPPAAELSYLADVARLEWAVNCALHATDAETLDMRALAAIADIPPDRVVLLPHPSISVLRLDYPAQAIWRAVLADDDRALGAIDLTCTAQWLMIERTAEGVTVQSLPEDEWRFVNALCSAQPLQDIVEFNTGTDVATLLARHLAAGRFVGFRVLEDYTSARPENIP